MVNIVIQDGPVIDEFPTLDVTVDGVVPPGFDPFDTFATELTGSAGDTVTATTTIGSRVSIQDLDVGDGDSLVVAPGSNDALSFNVSDNGDGTWTTITHNSEGNFYSGFETVSITGGSGNDEYTVSSSGSIAGLTINDTGNGETGGDVLNLGMSVTDSITIDLADYAFIEQFHVTVEGVDGLETDDTLIAGQPSSNTFDLGSGINDRVVYQGSFDDYDVALDQTEPFFTYSVSEVVQEGANADILTNVELVQFADGQLGLESGIFTPSINGQESPEDAAWTFIVPAFADMGDGTLTYTAAMVNDGDTSIPSWLTFNAATRTFTGTPPLNFNGSIVLKVTATDTDENSASNTFTLDITPVNDAAIIGGVNTGGVTEDGTLTASGALTITDVDSVDEQAFQDGTIVGLYGSLSIDVAGAWSYTLNNSLPAVQALNNGQTLTDTITVLSDDGTSANIIITINGANENSGVTLTGTALNDTFSPAASRPLSLRTTALNDTVFGLGGNDTIDGGLGADQMHGGLGNDTYRVDNVNDQAIEVAGEGKDTVSASLDWALGANLENLVLKAGAILGSGNELANQITGTGGNNVLAGLGGKDTLIGGAGSDTFVFGAALASSVDTIKDFSVVDDLLQFNASDYGFINSETLVVTNGTAASGNGQPQFVFNTATKVLSWDADGLAGGLVAVAKLTGVASLSVSSFSIVSDIDLA